jgi:hydroxymethylpyrimidine/phosphomethylpyrimidine kinase
MVHDPTIRSSMNIRFSEEILAICRELGFSIGSYDRIKEPAELKNREGSTVPWGISEAIKKLGFVPDVVYHTGDWGKEPMISIFGTDPSDVVEKARSIASRLIQRV